MTEQKPNSRMEKNKQWEDKKVFERWMYVHELRALLDNLNDDDWITPNYVRNLVIGRGDKDGLGIIDFYWNRIDWFQIDSEQADLNDDKTVVNSYNEDDGIHAHFYFSKKQKEVYSDKRYLITYLPKWALINGEVVEYTVMNPNEQRAPGMYDDYEYLGYGKFLSISDNKPSIIAKSKGGRDD